MPRPLLPTAAWLVVGLALRGLALAGPAWGHGDEARDQPPPVKADFAPPVPGTYTLHCDNFCGDGHEDMVGRIVVTD